MSRVTSPLNIGAVMKTKFIISVSLLIVLTCSNVSLAMQQNKETTLQVLQPVSQLKELTGSTIHGFKVLHRPETTDQAKKVDPVENTIDATIIGTILMDQNDGAITACKKTPAGDVVIAFSSGIARLWSKKESRFIDQVHSVSGRLISCIEVIANDTIALGDEGSTVTIWYTKMRTNPGALFMTFPKEEGHPVSIHADENMLRIVFSTGIVRGRALPASTQMH